ncbi:Cullin repeat-like-containing domain protein [Syncephalastrum racemosum]|uniref:Exocyst complex component EXO84 n=1 Tax=Syncephalastrum racemosum TaxID=13706 RepID=A0A1X2H5V3_SYNRA|nr:Cullin repeat-like-containing domain protein [Syncephalastrum racemosum]
MNPARALTKKANSSSGSSSTASEGGFRKKDKAIRFPSSKTANAALSSISSPSSQRTTTSSSKPAMPSTTSSAAPSTRTANTNFPFSSGPVALDLHRFADENLNPDDLVRRSLADANEEGIRAFHRSLVEAKHVVGGDLQRNVYRNYTEFVTISKEVSNLDGDVLALKGYLNELRSIWDGFMEEANPSESITPIDSLNEGVLPRRKRSELMNTDLHSIYRAQIAALWENVEGSQKFVPFVHGRHIVRECVNFMDINPKTLQPRQIVHLFVLNDCLLVASRKKRSAASRYKLVADYCWSLQEISIVDVKDSPGLNNAIKVAMYPYTFLYRAERPEDKLAFVHAYKRAMDENDDRQQDAAGVDYRGGKDSDQRKEDAVVKSSDRKWLADMPDDLEVLISLRQFEKAVSLIEQARALLASYTKEKETPVLRDGKAQVQKYTELLCTTISSDLSNTLLTKLQFQRLVNWLLRLNKGDQAQEVFLSTRSKIIKKRIRQLAFEGDIATYINELALVVFTLIRNTCEWYRDSFKQNEMASRFITWVREQTETYADIYKRQVFNHSQINCQVISDCFKSTLDQCSVLRKVGLDLKFLLEDFFLDNVRETVLAYEKRSADKAEKFAKSDTFQVVSAQGLGADVKVTASVMAFYNMLVKYVNDICLISRLQLYETVVRSISRITEHYLRTMIEQCRGQRAVAAMNTAFVLDNIVPRVSNQLNRHFDRPIPELDALRARLRGLCK